MQLQNIQITGGLTVIPEILSPTGDPYWANVSLLMNTTSTNNQTNNLFLDSSSSPKTLTNSGTLNQGTFSPFVLASNTSYNPSVNGGSGLFSAGQLSFTEQTISGDFTAECWFYRTGNAANYSIIFGGNAGSPGADNCQLYVNNDGSVAMYLGGAVIGNSGTAVTTGAWHHIVWVKSGTNAAIFVNGTRVGTGTTSANLIYQVISGAAGVGSGYYAQGYLSSCRVVNAAVYNPANTTITVPTSPLTAITNTNLLLNFTNAGMYDSAAKTNLIGIGTTSVSTAQSKFDPTSTYIGGLGNYIYSTSPDYAMGTGDFTLECWVYFTDTGDDPGIIQIGPGLAPEYINSIGIARVTLTADPLVTNTIFFINNGTYTVGTVGPTANNTWVHVSVARQGTTHRLFVNGELSATVTDSTNYTGTTFIAGTAYNLTYPMTGYVQDIRITKGVARYTAPFTPPTAPFPTN